MKDIARYIYMYILTRDPIWRPAFQFPSSHHFPLLGLNPSHIAIYQTHPFCDFFRIYRRPRTGPRAPTPSPIISAALRLFLRDRDVHVKPAIQRAPYSEDKCRDPPAATS